MSDWGEPQPVVIAPHEIKAESVKCANPDARRCLWHGCRDSLCEFASSTIRESEDEDRGGIDPLRYQARDAFHQRSRFTRAGTGLDQEWRTPVSSGAVLRRIRSLRLLQNTPGRLKCRWGRQK